MTITLEEFDALPADVRRKYLRAAHGVVVRMANGIHINAHVVRENDNYQIVGKCLDDMRSIRRQAKGLDVKTKDLS